MTQDMITLGFDRIIEQLQNQAVSQAAHSRLAETEPILHEGLCRARMEETTAALRVMENAGTPPISETDGTETGLIQAAQGGMLLPSQLCAVARFCATVQRLRRYLQNVYVVNPSADFNRAPATKLKGMPFDLMAWSLKDTK